MESDLLIIYIVSAVVGMSIGGAVGYYLGKAYRNQPVAGFWFGFFFGAVGWLLLILLDDKRRKCPSCGLGVTGVGNTCPHCRAIMRPKSMPNKRSKYEARHYYCLKCGEKGVIRIVEGGTITVCPSCEQRLDNKPRRSQPTKTPE